MGHLPRLDALRRQFGVFPSEVAQVLDLHSRPSAVVEIEKLKEKTHVILAPHKTR